MLIFSNSCCRSFGRNELTNPDLGTDDGRFTRWVIGGKARRLTTSQPLSSGESRSRALSPPSGHSIQGDKQKVVGKIGA